MQAGIESSNAGKAADALQHRDKEYRSLLLSLENTQTVLQETQDRLTLVEREHTNRVDAEAQLQQMALDKLQMQCDTLRREGETASKGLQFWKANAEVAERRLAAVERQGAVNAATSTSTCTSCEEKDSAYSNLQEKYGKLESDKATLSTAKKGVQGQLLTLTNQHAALEKSSQRELAALRDQIDELNDEIEYLRAAAAAGAARNDGQEEEQASKDRVVHALEDNARTNNIQVEELVKVAIAEKEESHRLALREEVEKCQVLQEELLELERSNELLRTELAQREVEEQQRISKQSQSGANHNLQHAEQQQEMDNKHHQQQNIIDSLNSQIRSLEIAFQDSNSSLLTSRSALVHTESRLGELERLLGILKGEEQRAHAHAQGGSSTTLSKSSFDQDEQGQEVQGAKNAFTEEYVLNLRAELEDEINLRVETESRAEVLEARIGQLVSERDELAKEGESTPGTEEESLRLDIEERALNRSQRALSTSETERASLLSEIESLTTQLSSTRSLLLISERKIQDLQLELSTMTAILGKRNEEIQLLQGEKEELVKRIEELEVGEMKKEMEMQLLKRDARALRDQLILVQQQRESLSRGSSSGDAAAADANAAAAATPDTSPRGTKHTRANSAPFCPSPLRTTSYPPSSSPYMSKSASSFSDAQENANHFTLLAGTSSTFPPTTTSALDQKQNESEENAKEDSVEERAVVLVARLRQERDEALQRLEYHLCENKVGMESLMEEMEVLRAEKKKLEEELRAGKEELVRTAEAEMLEPAIPSLLPSSSSTIMTDPKITSAPLSDIEDSAQRQHQEAHLESLAAQISSLTSYLEDRQTVIHTLLSERDSLFDQLSCARLSLKGAQNLSRSLRGDLDALTAEYEAFRKTSGLELEEMEDEIQQNKTYLVGAQNLVLRLEQEKKAVLESLEDVRGELLAERSASSELEVESERALKGLVLALLSTRKAVKASYARQIAEEAQMTNFTNENTRLQKELAAALSQQTEEVAAASSPVELVYAVEEQQEQINQLIVLLIESSRRTGYLATRLVEADAALSASKDEIAARKEALEVAQDDLELLKEAHEDALSKAQRMHERQLTSLREEMDSASTQHSSSVDALRSELTVAQQATQAQNERVRSLETDLVQATTTVEQLRDALRLAEEEGKNLVQDFNLLSEEFEKRQSEDETRCVVSTLC